MSDGEHKNFATVYTVGNQTSYAMSLVSGQHSGFVLLTKVTVDSSAVFSICKS